MVPLPIYYSHYKLHLYIFCASQRGFITITLYSCILNHIEYTKAVTNKNTHTLSFIFTCVVAFTSILYVDLSYNGVFFHFSLKDFLYYFLQGSFACDEFPQFLFTWGCLNFYFILNGLFFCIQNSWLTEASPASFQYFENAICFLAFMVSDEKSADSY